MGGVGRMSSALVSAVVSCGVTELSSWSRETTCWGFRGRDSILVTLVSHTQSKCVIGSSSWGGDSREQSRRRALQTEDSV